ncbi:MAG: hypothetical protein HY606_08135 [Planctomycetes bacterium]|nr:hypothetical protein [Planctomycetota bacterium]
MTGYERTRRAIEFGSPDKIPVCGNALETDYDADVVFVFCEMRGTRWWQKENGTDEWGCLWKKSEINNMGQVAEHPIKEWNDLQNIKFPDPNDSFRYYKLEEILKNTQDKYVVLCNGSVCFERMHFMRGFETLLEDIYINRKKVEELADRLIDFQIRTVENIAKRFKGKIHGFRLTDDWGTQEGLIISPVLWREIFKSRYKAIFDTVHKYQMHIWLHSCGKINDLIEDLIAISLDVINLEQPRLLSIEEIGKKFSGRICFESHADIQTTLVNGDVEKIREEVMLLLKYWRTPKGGFILGDCDPVGCGLSRENKMLMKKFFQEYGYYK